MNETNPKYKEWEEIFVSKFQNKKSSVKLGYVTFPLMENEICIGYQEWSQYLGCSIYSCREFFNHLEKEKIMSRRQIGSPPKYKTVYTLFRTLPNAHEQRASRGSNVKNEVKNSEPYRTLMDTGVSEVSLAEQILSKITNPKAIQLLKDHPEIISRNLTRWFDGYEKRKKKSEEQDFKSAYPEYASCVDEYWKFFKSRHNDNTPLIDFKFGRNMNDIISAIRTSIKNQKTITPEVEIPDRVLNAWRKILYEWDNYSDFIKNDTTLAGIKGKYDKIINELTLINNGKHAKPTKSDKRKQAEFEWASNNIGRTDTNWAEDFTT